VGLPVGPQPWTPEPVGAPDAIVAAFEGTSLVFFGLLLLKRRADARPVGRRWVAGLSTAPLFLLLAPLSFYGVEAGLHDRAIAMNMGTAMAGLQSVALGSLVEWPGPEPVRSFTLTAEVQQTGPAEPSTFDTGAVLGFLLGAPTSTSGEAWTYNGTVPGPELRVREGDRVRVTLLNHLPESTSIHWHGLRLPNAEDGVVGVTQDAVPPGQSFTYEFVAKDPGTYWYHSHQNTEGQVPRGLYGALIVEPSSGVTYDRDYSVIVGDAQRAVVPQHLDANPGERVRLRLTNAFGSDMTGLPGRLVLVGVPYTIVALDGHDLNKPQTLGPEVLQLGMGQRYDLVFRMPESGQVRVLDERPRTGSAVPVREWVTLGRDPLRSWMSTPASCRHSI